MTQHEQHMEIYATAILGTLRVATNALLHSDVRIDREMLANSHIAMSKMYRDADKITELRNKMIEDEKQETENKYLKLYQDSEDMRMKCQRVIATMCTVEGIEDGDLDIIEAWSVVKCVGGRVLVTVDYWKDNNTVRTYQFPVSWLDLSEKQLEEKKVGCQLV